MNKPHTPLYRALRVSDGGSIFLIGIVSLYLMQSLFTIIVGFFAADDPSITKKAYMQYIIMVLNQAVFIAAPFIYGRLTRMPMGRELKLNKGLSPLQIVLVIVCAFVSIAAFYPLAALFIQLMQKLGYSHTLSLPAFTNTLGNTVISIIFCALLPAVGEEIFMRGSVARSLKSGGYIFAVLITSLLFSTMHGNLLQLVYQFFLSVVMTVVYFTTRSLYASMTIHFTNNAAALIIDYILFKTTGSNEINLPFSAVGNVFLFLGISLAGIILLCFALFGVLKVSYNRQKKLCDEDGVELKKGVNIKEKIENFFAYMQYDRSDAERAALEEERLRAELDEVKDEKTRERVAADRVEEKARDKKRDRMFLALAVVFVVFVLIVNTILSFRQA